MSPSDLCAYLGPEGTYTEEAALAVAADAEHMPLTSIEAVFQAVADGRVGLGVVPIENLIQGPVTEVLDCLYEHADHVRLSGMRVLPIRHALGVKDPEAPIEAIYSKDQALKQCSRFLQRHYPGVPVVSTASTTAPMRDMVEGKLRNAAVIGNAEAMRRHGLSIVAADIGNTKANKTKFAVLKPRDVRPTLATGADTTLCVVYPHRDRVGLLRTVVDVVSDRFGLNLSAIHSRPDAQGSFRFYLEIEGHESDPTLVRCFDTLRAELSAEHVDVVVVGSFPRTTFIEHFIKRVSVQSDETGNGEWLEAFLPHGGYDVVRGDCVDCDAVVLSGSASGMAARAQAAVARLSPGQLLVVDCECQERALAAALEVAPAGVEVLGLNVLPSDGGPDERKRHVVFIHTDRSDSLSSELEAMFYKQGARLSYSSPERHDRQMAFHRHLTMLTQLALAETGAQLFGNQATLERLSSRASRALRSEVPGLLADGARGLASLRALGENREAPAVVQAYLSILQDVGTALAAGDPEPLVRVAKRVRDTPPHEDSEPQSEC